MGFDLSAERRRKERQQEAAAKSAARTRKIGRLTKAFADGFTAPTHVCTQCGQPARPKLITKGNILLEIFLWLCFFLPGIAYTVWRHASRFYGCPDCRTQTMVKIDSPMGRKLIGQ